MDDAFGVKLCWVTDSKGDRYMSYKGPLYIPKPLAGVVVAVLGLDQRPVAKHHTLGNLIRRPATLAEARSVKRLFAVRTRFPAAVNPHPLVRMFANDLLEDGV